MRDHIVEGSRCTGHLQTYIEAADTELEHCILYRLPFGAIHRKGCSHLLRYLQTKRIDVSNDDVLRSRIAADTCRHRADEARTRDEYVFAKQRESQGCMGGISEGIHDGREVIRDIRVHFDHIRFRNRDELCKAAVASHDTEGDRVLAHMPHASAAVTAVSTRDMSFRCDAVANLEIAHTGTAVGYDAHKLMTHGIGRFAVGLRPLVPLVHMQVSATDSGLSDLDDHIVDAHFGRRDVFHPDTRFGIFLY